MAETWTFRNLDMSDVDAQRPSQGLPVGRHVCVINHAELKPSTSGIQVILYLAEIEGLGLTRDYITIHSKSTDPNMKTAERIGKERFKAVLEFGGHPNPNNPSDIRTIPGIVVGVIIEQSEDWVDEKGATRKGGTKPKKSGAYMRAADLGYTGPLKISTTHSAGSGAATSASTGTSGGGSSRRASDMDDDIPF